MKSGQSSPAAAIGQIKRNWGLYLLLLPAVVLTLLFAYKPMYGVLIAFKNYSPALGIDGSPWAGFKYFDKFFNSYQFSNTIKNTLIISVYSLITFPIPIILALMVNQMRPNRFRRFFQTVSYMPHFISTVVMVGLMMILLSPSTGLVGNLYSLFGGEAPDLMGSTSLFSSVYVWSDVWQHVGFNCIIFIAALASIDPSLHEAAVMDGATKFRRMWHIDLPGIMPMAIIVLILNTGHILDVGFEKVLLMQNPINLKAAEIIDTYVYKVGLTSQVANYSYSTAIGLFKSIINLILLLTVNKIAQKTKQGSLW